jgi:hypothetical protein
MKHPLFLVAPLLAACASSGNRLGEQPDDLITPGGSLDGLVAAGWEISPPVARDSPDLPRPDAPSSGDGRTWSQFLSGTMPGDEIRSVRNNAGVGYALFRGGIYQDLYLVVIF